MIVVTGAGGQLGTAFRELLGDRGRYLTRDELDLADLDAIGPAIAARTPDLVVNCAAYTAVDRAEDEPDVARTVNALAPERLAAAAREAGAAFVTYSTDYVFRGDAATPYVESSPPDPQSAYGRSKREGEERVLAAHDGALVVRTAWVLSGTHRNFAATMLRLARQGPVDVVDDQTGRPTLVGDLAPATMAAVAAGAAGLLHLTNQGTLTWYRLAREVLELAGMDRGLIRPTTTAQMPRPAPRPAYSVLASERLAELGIPPLPHYRSGLSEAVGGLLARGF